MAEINPLEPQINDPELEANLIRGLSVVGQLGKLRVLDIVIPTFSLGEVLTQAVEVRQPAYRSTDQFEVGFTTAPAAGTVLADTGPLPAGIYDLLLMCQTQSIATAVGGWQVVHRNAANTGAVGSFAHLNQVVAPNPDWHLSWAYEILVENERVRIETIGASGAGAVWYANIWARLRT